MRIRSCIAAVVGLLLFLVVCGGWMELRSVEVRAGDFEESNRPLANPNRGFYRIYGFQITDEEMDYPALVGKFYSWDTDTTLALVEINLMEYREGEISPAGLQNLDALLRALCAGDKQLIVRFLYDCEGKNRQTEPERLEVILRHMEQVGELLRRYEEKIFTLQGLFVGDWGEMHNTDYESAAELRLLAQTLAGATGAWLSVRTPAQWRLITGDGADLRLAVRLGLFNDGIMGSEGDLGTYDMAAQADQRRTRVQELAFQEILCRSVPNGGEVVVENPYNDFENAVQDLEQMRVTYLNQDYDAGVLKKWADARVSEEGCFHEMDGLSYVERRLGYRLFIREAALRKDLLRRQVNVKVIVQNAGFAPLYAEPEVILTLRDGEGRLIGQYPAEHSLRTLTGGRDTEKTSEIRAAVSVEGLPKGSYQLCLDLKDPASGENILLANTQDRDLNGYVLGEIQILH
ncbi:DUF4832 domain-containing protein [Pseudoflavonifractor sp. 524-17]|nr:DUF4832 domain-containing protein [Pseudoflavonifractor sp. 524-17]